jgi:hypothetical protein
LFPPAKDPHPEVKANVDAVVGGRRVTFGGKLPVPAR